MNPRIFDSNCAGAFRIGIWHRSATQTRFSWDAVEVGQKLGPFLWVVEPYEAAILCYQIEINDARFLPRRDKIEVVVHPFIASRASFNLLQAHYILWEGAFLDFEHIVAWSTPLIAGRDVILTGEITGKYEKRGRLYLEWNTQCRDRASNLIFDVKQKVVSPRFRYEKGRSGENDLQAHPSELLPAALDEIDGREIDCFLGWSRRNSFPPHPNLHTDFEQARSAGLAGIIMPGAVLGAHLFQAALDHYGDDFCHGSIASFKLVCPILTESKPILRIYRNRVDHSLHLKLEDAEGKSLVIGNAALSNLRS